MTDFSMIDAVKKSICAGIGASLLYVGINGIKKEIDCSKEATYHHMTPYEKHLERMNQKSMLEEKLNEPIGLINEIKDFYYSDIGNAMSLSSMVHDAGGFCMAFAFGASRVKNKLAGLVISYKFAMIPEIVNAYNGHIAGRDMAFEAGRDALMVLGAFGIGKLANYIASSRRRMRYYAPNVANSFDTQRAWWSA